MEVENEWEEGYPRLRGEQGQSPTDRKEYMAYYSKRELGWRDWYMVLEGGAEDVGGKEHGARSRGIMETMLRSLIFGL